MQIAIENYTKGLMLPIARKSVEPMAARLAPAKVRQMHQSLHHIVAHAAWSDDALLKQVRRQVLPVDFDRAAGHADSNAARQKPPKPRYSPGCSQSIHAAEPPRGRRSTWS
jgi:uncharacterized membrane-anchored protein YhcB (DUF1043 family)